MGSYDFLSCVSNASSLSAALSCADAALAAEPAANIAQPVSTEPAAAPGATLAAWAASVPAAIGLNMNKLFDMADAVRGFQETYGSYKPYVEALEQRLGKLGDSVSAGAKQHAEQAIAHAKTTLERLKQTADKAGKLDVRDPADLERVVDHGERDVKSVESWVATAEERLKAALNPDASHTADAEPVPAGIDSSNVENIAKSVLYTAGMFVLGAVALSTLGVKVPHVGVGAGAGAAPVMGPTPNPYET